MKQYIDGIKDTKVKRNWYKRIGNVVYCDVNGVGFKYYAGRHIPIWEEIVNIPDDYYECQLPDIDWKDVDGMTIPFRIINKATIKD